MKKKAFLALIVPAIIITSCRQSGLSSSNSATSLTQGQSSSLSSESSQSSSSSSSQESIDNFDLDHYDLERYIDPFWSGNLVSNESVMVLKKEDGSIDPLRLLYPINRIVSVRNYGLNIVFKADKDYEVHDGKLFIIESGDIFTNIALDYDEYYFPEYDPESGNMVRSINGGGLLSTEASYGIGGLCDFQIIVTYTHDEANPIDVPETKSEKFRHVLSKLNGGDNVNITILGDSISAGWSASGYQYANIDPHTPPYANMFADFLAYKFPETTINLTNLSVGGKTAEWGAESAQTLNVIASAPDLVIIAFGMNDGISGGYSVDSYRYQINQIIDTVHGARPQTEFMVVSTMLPNAEVYGILHNQYNYLEALAAIEKERDNVALADITTESVKMLFRKRFMDISANNKNHPNDFVHRLYAQVLAKTLLENV